MEVAISRSFEIGLMTKLYEKRPVILVGTRKVTYEYGSYHVRNATTDKVMATYNDRGMAVHNAVINSMRG